MRIQPVRAVDACTGFVVLVGRDGVGRWIGALRLRLFSAVLVGLFVGWKWPPEEARASSDLADSPLGWIWLGLLRYVAPPAILLILLQGLDVL